MKIRQAWPLLGAFFAFLPASAIAAPVNLIQNGDFENSTSYNTVPYHGFQVSFNGVGQVMDLSKTTFEPKVQLTTLADWTVTCVKNCGLGGWTFIGDSLADDSPATPTYNVNWPTPTWGMPYILSGSGNPENLTFWGPDNQRFNANNGFTISNQGGKFLAIDGDYGRSNVSQTITGLDTSKTYELTFEYAGAQQGGFDGATDQKWIVTIDGQAHDVGPWTNPSHGFTPWKDHSIKFQPTSPSSTIVFEPWSPDGTGLPPFLLLDDVKLFESTPDPTPDPAPGPLPLLGAGAALGWSRRIRRLTRNQA